MTVAMHILRKDVRRYAWWIVAWAGTCALVIARDVVMEVLTPIANGNDLPTPLRILAMVGDAIAWISPLVRTLLFVLLVPMVVHEDTLVDSRAFWLTRPIGGRKLLLGKLVFVVLVLVLPGIAAEIAELAVGGAHARQIALAAPEIALEWSLWAASLFALSSLTGSFPGLLVAFARAVALAICVLVVLMLPLFSNNSILQPYHRLMSGPEVTTSLTVSRMIVGMWLAIGLSTIVTAIQYLTRRTRLGWTAIAASLTCLTLVYLGWRWDFVAMSAAATFAPARELVVRIDSIAMTSWDAAAVPHSDKRRFDGTVRAEVDGIPPPLVAEIESVDGSLVLPSGTRVSIDMEREPTRAWNLRGVEAVLGGARTANRVPEGVDGTTVTMTTSADLRTLPPTGRLSMRVYLRPCAYHVAAVLPLEVGARHEDDTTRTAIASFACAEDYCGVELDELRIRLLRSPDPAMPGRVLPMPRENALYLLRNRNRGEVLWPASDPDDTGWPSMRRLRRLTSKLVFRATPGPDGRRVRIDDAWVAGAEIVRVEADSGDAVRRKVEVDRFALVTPPLPIRP
jgi:hypothetical protein